MTPTTPPDLSSGLLAQSWAFLLIGCRCGGALVLLPGFGDEGVSPTLRGAFALPLTVLLLPVLGPGLPPMPAPILAAAGTIAAELAAGLLVGWLARTAMVSLAAAGQSVALATGLTSVLLPDATFGAQASVTGRLLGVGAPALVLASGLYALPLQALAGSYAVLPAGQMPPVPDGLAAALGAVGDLMALSLRLAAPFLVLGLLWQTGLGLLSRFVPQLQVYFAALPGQVLGGLLLLALMGGGLCRAWMAAMQTGFAFPPVR